MIHNNKKVAFIVVGWNNKGLLSECFDSIYAQTYSNITVIYIDNSSADESASWVRKNYPKVIVLAQDSNTGFAKGNNIGIKQALEDQEVAYVALLNTDARLAPDWVEKMVQFAALKPIGAMFQGTTLDYYNHNIIDSTHIFVSRWGQGTQGNWRNYVTKELGPKKVFGVNAAACMISRAFIDAQPFSKQFFDESMFMYLEDVDVATRATVMGWDNYLVSGASAYHMGSASSGKNPNYSLYMTFRNNTGVLIKNLPLRILMRVWPKVIRGDIDTIRQLRRTGKESASRALIRGRVVGVFRAPIFMLKRAKVLHKKQISNDYLWKLMDKGY